MIPDKFWKEIEHFENKIVLVSGGKESSAIALEFWKRKVPCYYMHYNTGLTMPTSRASLKKLYEHTKDNVIDFITINASDYLATLNPPTSVKKVIDSVFEKMDEMLKDKESSDKARKNWRRHQLVCCDLLKKNPAQWYFKENKENFPVDTTVRILGLSKYEGHYRSLRLTELAKANTFLRYQKAKKGWYAYPLRDTYSPKTVPRYLERNGFGDVKSSGCSLCPVLLIFRMIDKDVISYAKTKKYFLKNFRDARFCTKLDHTLDEFFQEVGD